MNDNNLYNLMLQLTQEQKSVWRIGKYYINDASACEECKKFWQDLKTQKENSVAKMRELIRKHLG